MEKCQSLPDYVVFVDTVRRYINQGYITRRAVDMAVEECIAKDILREFLVRNKTGVMRKLFGKEDWERYKQREMKVLAEETVRRVAEETDLILRKWSKLAERAESIEEFQREQKNII